MVLKSKKWNRLLIDNKWNPNNQIRHKADVDEAEDN